MSSVVVEGVSTGAEGGDAGGRGSRLSVALPIILMTVAGAAYFLETYLPWRRRVTVSFDPAIFTQAVKGYAHLSAPIVDLKGPGFNQLGDHFSPILAVLAPIYRLFPSGLTLEAAQVLVLALSVLIVCRIAIRHLGSRNGTLVGIGYAFSFGLQSGVQYEFHPYCFSALFLAMVGSAYLRGRWTTAALWSLPLLLVKEDMGVVVAALGVCFILKGARRLGGLLVLTGTAYTYLVVFLVIPALNPDHKYNYLAFAAHGNGSLLSLAEHVSENMVWPPIKLLSLGMALAVGAFMCLRSWFVILIAPLFFERFMAPLGGYWGPYWQYSIPIMAIVVVAAIEALARERPERPRFFITLWRRHAAVIMAAFALLLVPKFGLGTIFHPSSWQGRPQAVAIDDAVARIPAGATVQADAATAIFAVPQHTVYYLAPPGQELVVQREVDADYAIADNAYWREIGSNAVRKLARDNPHATYRVVSRSKGIVLLRRTSP